MKNMNYNHRNVIYLILFLWPLGAHAATLPPDPDNAALLYYQAFLLRPEPDAGASTSIDEVIRGGEPDEKLREYLDRSDCRETIELAEAAAQLSYCNWGIRFSQGARLPQLVHIRPLKFLLYADARVLAMDGDYQAAFNRCLTIYRIAGHVGDVAMLNHVVSVGTERSALSYIQNVLGFMPPDIDILIWLRSQLATVQGAVLSPVRVLEMDLELIMQSMRNDPNDLLWLREQLAEDDEGNDPEYFWNLTDEELIALITEPYADFLDYAIGVIDSEMPYEEKYTELQRLTEELQDEFGNVPGTKQLVIGYAPKLIEFYSIQVRHTAQFNTLKAAIEIYLVAANTGKLPDTLPEYLPKDPFSGQDFEYEITEKGFILRCRAKDIQSSQNIWPPGTDAEVVREYEFELQM